MWVIFLGKSLAEKSEGAGPACETFSDIQGHRAPCSILPSPWWEFFDKHLTLKEWFNGAAPSNVLSHTFP